MRASARVTIYEASNEARRELYIGTTTLSMSALIASFGEAPPRALRHWSARDVRYRSLEFGMPAEDAAAFIRRYASGRKGWRVIKSRKTTGAPKAR